MKINLACPACVQMETRALIAEEQAKTWREIIEFANADVERANELLMTNAHIRAIWDHGRHFAEAKEPSS